MRWTALILAMTACTGGPGTEPGGGTTPEPAATGTATSPTATATGTATGAPGCTCTAGDTQLANGSACPPSATCYLLVACGAQIQCAHPEAGGGGVQCNAIPTCPQGTRQVGSQAECSASLCSTESACGHTIYCTSP